MENYFLNEGTTPYPRSFHTTIISGTDVYLFGGGESEHEFANDLYTLDMLKMRWSLVHPPSHTDVQPRGRAYHTMTLISPKAAAVFGGEDEGESVLGDCWLLDLEAAKQGGEVTNMWKRYLCQDPCRHLCVHLRSEHTAGTCYYVTFQSFGGNSEFGLSVCTLKDAHCK